MSNEKLVVCLPTFFSPRDKRSTGGTISNFALVKELAKLGEIDVISPIVSPELILKQPNNVQVITQSGLEGESLSTKARKKVWLRNQIRQRSLRGDVTAFISTNGTSSFVNSVSPKRNIILTRAFEDFFDYQVNGENFKERLRKKVLEVLIDKRVKQCYQDAAMVITNSQFMRSEISRHFKIKKEKIAVLYPPVDFPETDYRPLPTTRKLRVGMINPKKIKGEDIFIALAKVFEDIEFVYFSREDRQYGVDNIIYKGWGSDPAKLFKSFDLLIAPSLWNEPFGRVAVEGIRSGIPVLVSNHGGIPETVTDSFVVKGDTLNDWKEKLIWLRDNPQEVAEAWQLTKQHTESFVSKRHNENLKSYFSDYFRQEKQV
ncbi:glycosyltransferase family 4 protein [Winslowiella toletana]|uniref:glycosyltransferase family 4 protein n=1 Tax=Winslowiella toletana TaxID=92490 RepID=UPI0028BF0CC1|nr:glycosyltransferase family 4 protein [Winslowiella toletana]WNN42982.1 glycosyltransferase family 4 protein [Winslowiella toletana]